MSGVKENMDKLIFIASAIAVGTVIPLQTAFNSRVGQLTSPLWAACVSFWGGTLAITAIVIARGGIKQHIENMSILPIYYFSGGLLGVLFVTTASFVTPRIGVATMLMSGLVGQLMMSTFLDHVGAFSGRVIPISPWRVVGIIFVFIGVLLIEQGRRV